MKITRCEDLVAWQLAMLLNHRVVAIAGSRSMKNDRAFCAELLSASEAISANIAEGFDRYGLPQFRYFLQIAKGSLAETATRIRHAYSRGYINERELNEVLVLCRRTRAVLAPLIQSLEDQIAGTAAPPAHDAPAPKARRRRRQRTAGTQDHSERDPAGPSRRSRRQDPTAKPS